MNKIEAYGKNRLKHRVERLLSLINLDGPPAILAREVRMIEDAMKLYSIEAWYKAVEHFEMERLKFSCGFCSHDGCDNHRDYDSPDLPELCKQHGAEIDAMAQVEMGGESDADVS